MTDRHFIPYGRQLIDDDDIKAVVDVLKSDWLTTGPAVPEFENVFAEYVEADHAVAVANGTAALHVAMLAAGVGPGDEVIVPALTFVASANAAYYVGATVKFADVDLETLLIDPRSVEQQISPRTRAIVVVDFAGLPCDLDDIRELADRAGLVVIEDASHAPGATYRGGKVGSLADLTTFSFHPVKHIATGEGGMVTTQRGEYVESLRAMRSHGITTDFRSREARATWEYDQVSLGYNYRMSDIQAALGVSQLGKQQAWLEKRQVIAERYLASLEAREDVSFQRVPHDRTNAWHLFPLRITHEPERRRRKVFEQLRAASIGVNVHYRPVYLNSFYKDLGFEPGTSPNAERAYEGLLSLPMWPGLSWDDQDRVIESVIHALDATQ